MSGKNGFRRLADCGLYHDPSHSSDTPTPAASLTITYNHPLPNLIFRGEEIFIQAPLIDQYLHIFPLANQILPNNLLLEN